MQKVTTFILILVVILLIIGGAYYLTRIPVSAPIVDTATSTATSTDTTGPTGPISTAGWANYQSSTYSLQYPIDFKQETRNGVNRLTVPIKAYFHTVLPGEVYLTLNDASTTCPDIAGDQVMTTTTLTTGATIFTKYEWSGVGAGQYYHGVDYVTKKNGLCYDVSLFTHSANGAGFYYSDPVEIKKTDDQAAADMKAFFNLTDTIVSTFQFNQIVKINI